MQFLEVGSKIIFHADLLRLPANADVASHPISGWKKVRALVFSQPTHDTMLCFEKNITLFTISKFQP